MFLQKKLEQLLHCVYARRLLWNKKWVNNVPNQSEIQMNRVRLLLKVGNRRDVDNGYFSKTQNIYNWNMSNLWISTYEMWYYSNGRDSILCNYCIFKMTYYNVLETSRGCSRLTTWLLRKMSKNVSLQDIWKLIWR